MYRYATELSPERAEYLIEKTLFENRGYAEALIQKMHACKADEKRKKKKRKKQNELHQRRLSCIICTIDHCLG